MDNLNWESEWQKQEKANSKLVKRIFFGTLLATMIVSVPVIWPQFIQFVESFRR